MAPDDKTSDACTLLQRGAITELLALHRRTYGTAVMAEETDEEKATREAAEAKAKADADKGGTGGEPSEAELAALGDAGRRALERIRAERDEAKATAATAADKAAKYDKLEEANTTEQQRKDEAAAEAAKTAADATLRLAKLEAALEAGLPHTAAARLVGTTKAELLKDAKAYAEELAANGTRQTRRTTSDADKGGSGPDGGMSSLIRRAAGRA